MTIEHRVKTPPRGVRVENSEDTEDIRSYFFNSSIPYATRYEVEELFADGVIEGTVRIEVCINAPDGRSGGSEEVVWVVETSFVTGLIG